MLLTGAALLNATWGPSPLPAPESTSPAQGSIDRARLEWCGENVAIIQDVHWASACVLFAEEQEARRAACLRAPGPHCDPLPEPDDSPDCTLPDARARALNQARALAEQQCLDEAMRGPARARASW